MSEYFSKPKSLEANVKVESDLFNYATKVNLKNATGVDTSDFSTKTDLTNLNSDVDKLDIDKLRNVPNNLSNLASKVEKLVPVPVDLGKLSDVVKNDVVKEDVFNAKIKNIEDKIPSIINLAATTDLNAKTDEVKNKISNITDLTTTTAFAAVENKIPNVSNSVKKVNYNTKINEIEMIIYWS